MNETDRELLEWAAKAAGMKIDTHYVDGGTSVWAGEPHNSDWTPNWNPLTDDGDAFRLAVKLKLETEFGSNFVNVGTSDMNIGQWHLTRESGDDLYAATRRAIVRAAAEIWKRMV